MNWTPQKNIRLGFWLVALVPVIMGFLGAVSLRSLFTNADDLAATNRTIRQLDKVYVELSDVDSAESQFVVTGKDESLAPYRDAISRLRGDLDTLDRLTAYKQPVWMQHLRALFEEKESETRHVIDLRRSEGPQAANQLREELARGSGTMDDIRRSIRQIRDTEQLQLQQNTSEQNVSRISTLILFVLVVGINIALVYTLYRLIRREADEARREEQRIRELAAELERRVEQRTEALKRSNEDLQQFAYVVSHDLQEPLRMVGTYTELLRRRYGGQLGPDADEYIDFAVDGVKRMTELIKDLLEYARAGESQDNPPEAVNSEEVLSTVLLNLQPRIDEARAIITYDRLPIIATHRIWLTQILQNLVGNALKYRSEQPPQVHISATQNGREITFAVRDNGVGIDPKYSDQVFGIFKRLQGRDVEGTGIGLAMCKKIVERGGGRIWFESEPGKGSTFYFTIPGSQVVPAAHAS